jgi:hypothetical protein
MSRISSQPKNLKKLLKSASRSQFKQINIQTKTMVKIDALFENSQIKEGKILLPNGESFTGKFQTKSIMGRRPHILRRPKNESHMGL